MVWIKSSPLKKPEKPEKPRPAPKPRRRKGEITAEDHALWAHVVRSATPLPGRVLPDLPEPSATPETSPREPGKPLFVLPAEPKARVLPPLSGIEKRMVKEVARGHRAIDSRIDLHGMRQAEAHAALNSFIYRAHASGAKLVLVITGKGGGLDAFGEERGVLKRLVPHWLADPVMRRMIIGFESAARGHGGEGALYVRIRRRREHA